MSTITWDTVKRIHCEGIQQQVALVEERVYPADFVTHLGGQSFQVRKRQCTYGIECNLRGHPCRWSGLNPDYDPFK